MDNELNEVYAGGGRRAWVEGASGRMMLRGMGSGSARHVLRSVLFCSRELDVRACGLLLDGSMGALHRSGRPVVASRACIDRTDAEWLYDA